MGLVRGHASSQLVYSMAPKRHFGQTVLRCAFNASEYEFLHRNLVQGLHRRYKRSLPEEEAHPKLDTIIHDDYHAATIRSSLRLFLGTAAGLRAWELISTLLANPGASRR